MRFSFKNLLFKESEETVEVKTEAIQETVQETPTPVQTTGITPIGQTANVNGTIDPKYVDILSNKLDSLDLEGEDYMELKEAVVNLLNIPGMNEQTAYLSAFGTLQPRGLTIDACTSSLKYYIEELNKQKDLFKNAQSSKYDTTVASVAEEIDVLSNSNISIQEQIESLNVKMQENCSNIAEKTVIMNENKVGLENEQSNFDATLMHFITALESDSVKIDKYLVSTKQA